MSDENPHRSPKGIADDSPQKKRLRMLTLPEFLILVAIGYFIWAVVHDSPILRW